MTDTLADLCKLITQGVYVIAVRDGERCNAFTAAWVMQVSFDPVLITFSINPAHYSYELLKKGGVCTVNVLARQQLSLAAHFGTDGLRDKMSRCHWQQEKSGAPVLSEALAYFDCEVSHYSDAGDHELVICRVVDAGRLNDGEVMLYSDTEDMDGSSNLYVNEENE